MFRPFLLALRLFFWFGTVLDSYLIKLKPDIYSIMWTNFLKIAWRNILKFKIYSFINVFGLTIGILSCLMIGLYINEELSYDTFHEQHENIAIVGTEHSIFGRMLNTPYPLGDYLEDEITGIEEVSRFKIGPELRLSADGETFLDVENVRYAEPSFFDIFDFTLLHGNPEKALSAPNNVILTREEARKLFGRTQVEGESLYWVQGDSLVNLQVSGIMQEIPSNSSIRFNALISYATLDESGDSWGRFANQTFVLFSDKDQAASFKDKTKALTDTHYDGEYETSFFALPLNEYHLSPLSSKSGFTGSLKYIYFFASVAFFIIIIAGVNFINLTTARVSTRTREVGIRKTLGAEKRHIIYQFLGESIILCLAACLLSLSLISPLTPLFNDIFGTHIHGTLDFSFIFLSLGFSVMLGVLAGLYPSFTLSGFSPSSVLKGLNPSIQKGVLGRKIMVSGQFAIALVLIFGSIVIFRQLNFIQNKDLGFNKEQLLTVELPGEQLWDQRKNIKDILTSHSGVIESTVADALPGNYGVSFALTPDDLSNEYAVELSSDKMENLMVIMPAVVDYNYIDMLGITLIAGRNFSENIVSDYENAYIISKKTAEKMGWTPEEAVGKHFGIKKDGTVIGVIDDVHINSLTSGLIPLSLQLHDGASWSNNALIAARIHPGMSREVINHMEEEFKNFAPYQPLDYEFIDERFDASYKTITRLGGIVGVFTFITIVIACLGLFGLAAFSTQRRTKEIGIRKILGAGVSHIIKIVTSDFIKLVIAGYIIAAPLSWVIMNKWLADFPYRIEMNAGIFLMAAVATLLIVVLAVSGQAYKAALNDPVESLRKE